MDTIPHTLDAVRVGQWFANRFVDTARYSSNGPASPEQEVGACACVRGKTFGSHPC